MLCWGNGGSGELGSAQFGSTPYPVAVVNEGTGNTPLTGVKQISAGGGHACALKYSGTVVCWGLNGTYQLGNGGSINSGRPVVVTSLRNTPNIVQIVAGENSTCALNISGQIACWGWLKNNLMPELSRAEISQLSIANSQACYIESGGETLCWGVDARYLGHNYLGEKSGANLVKLVTNQTIGAEIFRASSYQRLISCSAEDGCSVDGITLSLGSGAKSPGVSEDIEVAISGIGEGSSLSLYSDSSCSVDLSLSLSEDGALSLSRLSEGLHKFYYAIDGKCSQSHLGYMLDATSPHAPFVYLSEPFPGTVDNPNVHISGWPQERVVATVYTSKNDIPCESEAAKVFNATNRTFLTARIPLSEAHGEYKFYTKAMDSAGNESDCVESFDVYEFMP